MSRRKATAVKDVTPLVEEVPIDEVSPDPANVRRHPERNASSVCASLRRFGPARSIVVDGKGVVRAGNNTLEMARNLGCESVLVVSPRPGQLVAVKRDDWSESEAIAYAIADNRSGELATWDGESLARQLEALRSEDFDTGSIGYTDPEIDEMMKKIADQLLVPEVSPRDVDESGTEDIEYVQCPMCKHKWQK